MNRIWLAIALVLVSSSPGPAAMAPKFERARQLAAALGHLDEIAHLLDEPIDRIEIAGGEVRFFAGPCSVSAFVRNVTDVRGGLGGRTSYVADLGKAHCS
jgi:hypothetical protein